MNKVLQAAGRVIRDAQDKGFVLLLDERFELLCPAFLSAALVGASKKHQ